MNYFILTYEIIVDSHNVDEFLTVGVQSQSTDYMPNFIKDEIIRKFRVKFPNRKVTTVLVKKLNVSQEEYQNAHSTFQLFFRNV